MSKISEKAQEFVDKLEAMVKQRDPEVIVKAELQPFGGMFVMFIKNGAVVDSYTLTEDLAGNVDFIRTWNGVL